MTNRITYAHLDMVRCLEKAGEQHVSVTDMARAACIAESTAIAYISHLRREFGYTVIDGTPTRGYRLDEWPGREVPRDGRKQRVVTPARRYCVDSGDGVVVTAAGRELGL